MIIITVISFSPLLSLSAPRFLTQRELRLVHWRQQVEAELRRTDGAEPLWKGQALSDQHMQKSRPEELQINEQEEKKTGRGERHREGERKEKRGQIDKRERW